MNRRTMLLSSIGAAVGAALPVTYRPLTHAEYAACLLCLRNDRKLLRNVLAQPLDDPCRQAMLQSARQYVAQSEEWLRDGVKIG